MNSGQCWRVRVACMETIQGVAIVLIVISLGYFAEADTNSTNENKFPEGFFLGAATSAYQIEGAWDTDGKGENIWDHLLHTQPNYTKDGSNGDIACDSYHKYQEDIDALYSIGANMYRFSFSWTRLLPTGYTNIINKEGIDYYNNVIDSMLAKNITPLATIYHFDLPQELQKVGGWPNQVVVDAFGDYARLLYKYFGDRVKWWVTFNEPNVFATGYASSGVQAPSIDAAGIGDYLTSATVIKAHALAWHIYDKEFRQKQQGKVGIAINCEWHQPKTDSTEDVEAAERMREFQIGLWMHPIFSEEGDYPSVVRERVNNNSKSEGFTQSRLPYFTADDVHYIRGAADFIGVTHYSTTEVTDETTGSIPSMTHDTGANSSSIDGYPIIDSFPRIQLVPWGIRKALNWLASSYPGYPIMILENGCSDPGTLEDYQRIAYLGCYMSEVLRAIHKDGVDVTSYLVWSLMDNFEWQDGYTANFGLHQVNMDDPQRARIPKASANFIKQIYSSGTVPLEYFNASTTDTNSICFTARNGDSSTRQLHAVANKRVDQRQSTRRQQHRGGKQQQRRVQKAQQKHGRVAHGKP